MKKFVCLGGFGDFNPEEPGVKDGDLYLFYTRKDNKLLLGKFFNSDENGSWGFTEYFTGKRYYPYTSQVISLKTATLEGIDISLEPGKI